jgi:phosphosulfolactate phosphohydrolase-like enzyme
MRDIQIRSWTETLEPRGVAVVFDIFRCSTTIHCLAARAAEQLWVAPALKTVKTVDPMAFKNMHVFSELRQEVDCAHRYDNSPELAEHVPLGQAQVVATTSGTPAMFAARGFKEVYVGSLVNFSALVRLLKQLGEHVTLIPARMPAFDPPHVEDDIAAEAMHDALLGDETAGERAAKLIRATGRVEELTKKLATGHLDTEISLHVDRFPSQIVSLAFSSSPVLAKVIKH